MDAWRGVSVCDANIRPMPPIHEGGGGDGGTTLLLTAVALMAVPYLEMRRYLGGTTPSDSPSHRLGMPARFLGLLLYKVDSLH